MAKKQEKKTESKKTSDKKPASKKKNDKTENKSKGGSFLDSLRPTTAQLENTRGTDKTKVETNPGLTAGTKKVVAGGIVAVVISALAWVGLSKLPDSSEEAAVNQAAPAAVVIEQQPIRALNEAAATSILPQPLAPPKDRLAETTKKPSELTRPGKTSSKKSLQLASKNKSKESVKKSVAATKKQKAVKQDKKAKKTLAAKSID